MLLQIAITPKGIIYCPIAIMALILGVMLATPLYASDPKIQTADVAEARLAWHQTSSNGVFNVTLDPQIDPATDSSIEINQFLEWVLTIKTSDNQIVTPARVTVSGGMPMHGHGLPTQPQVGEYLGGGKYMLRGLMFSMNGRWSIELDIQSKSLRDQVIFEIKLDP